MPESNDHQENQFEWTKNPAYRSTYANQTQLSSTAFDFAMVFGEIVDVSPDASHVKIEQQVKVVMSPLHFRLFVAHCAIQIRNYEERFGKIPIPSGNETLEQEIAASGSKPSE
jgi:hypothetical protein